MTRSPHESSFSYSRRHFQRIIGKMSGAEAGKSIFSGEDGETLTSATSAAIDEGVAPRATTAPAIKKKTATGTAVSRFRSAVSAVIARRRQTGLGTRVTGTLFGHRRGHVHFAFQMDSRSTPAVLLELATPTSTLVREMASGLVRIALECDASEGKGGKKLLEEPLWRAYCNGKKCGFAVRRECGLEEWKVLKAVEPVSMGAGVLPAGDGAEANGEMMYMRAKFERVVGSKDSEAFYMMSPDGNGGPELSIYLLRV